MKKLNVYIVLCVSLLCVYGFDCLAAAELLNIPQGDYFSAALNYQEQKCEQSLDVKYTVESLAEPRVSQGRKYIRYVRTPQMLFLDETVKSFTESGDWELLSTAKYSYNRQTREYKEIVTYAHGGNKVVGKIGNNSSFTRFQQNTVLDPIRYSLLCTPLNEMLKNGKTDSEQNVIDKNPCWRINIPPSDTGCVTVGWSIWLDSNIGCCPRKIIQTDVKTKGTTTTTTTFNNYKCLADGVWFPMEMIADYGDGTGIRIKVQDAIVGKNISEDDLKINYPSGASVRIGKEKIEIP